MKHLRVLTFLLAIALIVVHILALVAYPEYLSALFSGTEEAVSTELAALETEGYVVPGPEADGDPTFWRDHAGYRIRVAVDNAVGGADAPRMFSAIIIWLSGFGGSIALLRWSRKGFVSRGGFVER